MNSIRKIVSLLLTGAVTCFLLADCGGGESASPGSSNPAVSVNTASVVRPTQFLNEIQPNASPETLMGVVTIVAGNGSVGDVNGSGANASFNTPRGVAVDASGNAYVADAFNNLIRKITPAGVVTTLAGSGSVGSANGTRTEASFNSPNGVAVDSSGNVYVADSGNNLIRKITSAGVVTTLAGSGNRGSANGTGTAASFFVPVGIAVNVSGNVYVGDSGNNLIRKITSEGVVTTLAGSGSFGSADGTGTAASFYYPNGVAVDASDNVYVADAGNNLIRMITSNGEVTTFAGNGSAGSANGSVITASFSQPWGVAVDKLGNVYVADANSNLIREIIPLANEVITLAGTGTSGSLGGAAQTASFDFPSGVAVDASGNVYIADSGNNLIRKDTDLMVSQPVVTTLAGSGDGGSTNGTGLAASFFLPSSIAVDKSGNVYVADTVNNMIRKITSAGVVTALAGSGSAGNANGTGIAASFNLPQGVAVDTSGNVYVADTINCLIRKITPAGVVTTLAGKGSFGSTNGTGTAASFGNPMGVAVDTSGNVYVGDTANNLIRKITSAGVVTTLAGSGAAGSANGTGIAASFNMPHGVAVDASGNVYVADTNNYLIRKITSGREVTTLAGNGSTGKTNGANDLASFSNPWGVAVDKSGNVYVADDSNNLIREISAEGVTTLAGIGSFGSANGAGTAASFSGPQGLAVDASGNVYVADTGNNLIRMITQ